MGDGAAVTSADEDGPIARAKRLYEKWRAREQEHRAKGAKKLAHHWKRAAHELANAFAFLPKEEEEAAAREGDEEPAATNWKAMPTHRSGYPSILSEPKGCGWYWAKIDDNDDLAWEILHVHDATGGRGLMASSTDGGEYKPLDFYEMWVGPLDPPW